MHRAADEPDRGYHFNTGRAALAMNGYAQEWLGRIPESVVVSFSGMGSPFLMGMPVDGEYVVDIGSGAGLDSQIAAKAVGPAGHVIGVDMTEAMLEKANAAKAELGLGQLEFRHGYAESLPMSDEWADLVISNGVVNLAPDKDRVFKEISGRRHTARPGGLRARGPFASCLRLEVVPRLGARPLARGRLLLVTASRRSCPRLLYEATPEGGRRGRPARFLCPRTFARSADRKDRHQGDRAAA